MIRTIRQSRFGIAPAESGTSLLGVSEYPAAMLRLKVHKRHERAAWDVLGRERFGLNA
jgi:hypothetical protein